MQYATQALCFAHYGYMSDDLSLLRVLRCDDISIAYIFTDRLFSETFWLFSTPRI